MEFQSYNNRIYYQEKTHHKQQLWHSIKPETINMLEANQNPSSVSKKAYLSLYQDQLEKELAARITVQNSNSASTPGMLQIKEKSMSIAAGIPFRDYHKQKEAVIEKHVNLNYNGGSAFYKSSDQHEQMRRKQQEELKQTLNCQVRRKSLECRYNIRQRQQINREIRQNDITRMRQNQEIKKQQMIKEKENIRSIILKQIEDEKRRKEDKNGTGKLVLSREITRHNPITNPIEYHIENPYILKQIQQKQQSRPS